MKCRRCNKPMNTITAEVNAIHFGHNFYACEHCGMLYNIYRPEHVVYMLCGDREDKAEDDWGKVVVSDKEYKKKHPSYIPSIYKEYL